MTANDRVNCFAVASGRVDAEQGVLFGVAVVTVGPALGHGVFVDGTTLTQVEACARQYQGGLKVKLNHSGQAGDFVGTLRDFRVEGDVLRADLHLLREYGRRAYILEIAETMPDSFGLSIAFSGTSEERDGQWFARCTEIYSADIVDQPAANPSGLFSKPTKPVFKMDDATKTEIQGMIEAALSSVNEKLSKLMEPCGDDDEKEMQAKIDAAAEKALKAFAANIGSPAPSVEAAPSAPVETPPAAQEKSFEGVVAEKYAECKSKVEAIQWAVNSHPKLHEAYLARVQSGERILL